MTAPENTPNEQAIKMSMSLRSGMHGVCYCCEDRHTLAQAYRSSQAKLAVAVAALEYYANRSQDWLNFSGVAKEALVTIKGENK